MIKNCNCCKFDKDVLEFYKLKNRGEGLSGYSANCLPCQKLKIININQNIERKMEIKNMLKLGEKITKRI